MQLIGEIASEDRADDHADSLVVEFFVKVSRMSERRFRAIEQHELQRIGLGDLLRRDLMATPVIDVLGDESTLGRWQTTRAISLRIVG